jgi:dihydrofolate reductase
MAKVHASLGMSLDGFIAGPNAGPDNALGDGGMRIHRWVYDLEAWRERQGLAGGRINQDDEVSRETFERTGAFVMGRRMFDEGEVGWSDPPPFQAPVFVLTNYAREPWIRQSGTTFTFVTDGPGSALEQARTAAGDKDIQIAGGANTIQQFLEAGLLDELQIHLAPVLLGDGVRLFEHIHPERVELEHTRVIDSPRVTHLRYRVVASENGGLEV